MIVKILVLVFFLIASIASAEKSKSELEAIYKSFQEQAIENVFVTYEGHDLYWITLKAQNSIGTIVISPGRTESRLSYYELAMAFKEAGYNVVLMEHKGQGKSFRYNKKSDVGHIEKFSDYVEEFSAFTMHAWDFVKGPYYLYASSMGAAVALLRPTVANSFSKIILSTPMFEIKTKGIPFFLVESLLDVKEYFNDAGTYAPFMEPFDPARPFEKNEYAKSKVRFEMNNELYEKNPGFRVGGPSIKWVRHALGVTEPLRKSVTQVTVPVLIFQSDDDRFVSSDRQNEFCALMKDCRIQKLDQSFHALHLDSDANVQKLIQETIGFFK